MEVADQILAASPSILGAERILVAHENSAKRNKLWREALEWMHSEPVLAIDTETTGLQMWRNNRVVGISVYGPNRSYYFPFRHGRGEALNLEVDRVRGTDLIRQAFEPLWSDSNRVWRLFNSPFDLKMVYQELGFLPAGAIEEGQTAAHLLNENEISLALKPLSDKYLQTNASQDEAKLKERLAEMGVKDKAGLWYLDPREVSDYACGDVELTWALIEFYIPFLVKHGLYDLWQELNEYSYMITEMETHGVLLDLDINRERQLEAQAKYAEMLAQLRVMTGKPDFNPNSAPQCSSYFGLVDPKTGKPSTAKGVIEARIALGPWEKREQALHLIETKQWKKADDLYYAKYPLLMESTPISPHENRHILHCNFRITGTVAGRLSCVEPNLQAVPRQSDVYRVKDAIVPREGYVLVELDYAQAELRMLAHEANIEGMAKILNEGGDLHGETAVEMTKIRGQEVTRDTAKRLNFGVVYGLGSPGLSLQIFVPESVASEFLGAYHGLWPQVREFSQFLERMARRDGQLELWTGRIRHYSGGCDCNTRGCRGWHKAMSNRIQGGVGEMVRIAMVTLWREFYEEGVRPLIQVHDSLLCEVPISAGPGVVERMKTLMERGPDDIFVKQFHRCPPKVDVKWSAESWGKAKPADKEPWIYGDYAALMGQWDEAEALFTPFDARTKEEEGAPCLL